MSDARSLTIDAVEYGLKDSTARDAIDVLNGAASVEGSVANKLANYYDKDSVDSKLEDYYDSSEVDTKLGSYYDKTAVDGKFDGVYDKDSVDTKFDSYYTKTAVNEIVAGINQFNIAFVDVLPTTDIDTHTLYFLAITSSEENNAYEEYMYVNSKWELLGTTKVDLTDYAKKGTIPVNPESTTNMNMWVEA